VDTKYSIHVDLKVACRKRRTFKTIVDLFDDADATWLICYTNIRNRCLFHAALSEPRDSPMVHVSVIANTIREYGIEKLERIIRVSKKSSKRIYRAELRDGK